VRVTAAPAVLYASAWLTHCRWARTQPLKELPPPGQPFKDKFLVQACQTTAATDDAKAIFESTDKDAIIDQKLLCTFNIPGVDTSAHEPNDSAVNATGRPSAGACASAPARTRARPLASGRFAAHTRSAATPLAHGGTRMC
jgi:hypothetical protein